MKESEAAKIMSLMSSMFPTGKMTTGTQTIWIESLMPLDAEGAWKACEDIFRSLDRFPSFHQFLEHYKPYRPIPARQAEQEAIDVGSVSTPEVAKFWLAKIREQLKAMPIKRLDDFLAEDPA